MSSIGTLGGFESNLRVFDEVANHYQDLNLTPTEKLLLNLLRGRLHETSMLDLGVGAGRTGYTFAALVDRYVGLDASSQMLERARALLGEGDNVELVHGNACDLSAVGGPFGLVLFSFNGIDAVGHEERRQVLSEVRRVMDPGGYFLFSSHSLQALPLDTRMRRSPHFAGSRLYELYARTREVRYARRIRRVNRKLDLEEARSQGWVIVPRIGHNFRIDDYYVDPHHQVGELEEVGFEVEGLYGVAGRPVSLPYEGRDSWLDYLCRVPG